MSAYVDIHSHVLPSIDDGPTDLGGALAMARAAAESGTRRLVATPHLRPDFPDVHLHELPARCQELCDAIEREQIQIELVCGAEVSLVWALDASADELALATYAQRGSDVLIETPASTVIGFAQLLFELRLKGLRVTLAHPERSVEFQRDPDQLVRLVEQGILLQLNAESLQIGDRKSGLRRLARLLCVEGLAHALASDGHRASSWRPVTKLASGVKAAAALIGPERAEWMAREAPAAILDGQDLPDPPDVVVQRRRPRLFGR